MQNLAGDTTKGFLMFSRGKEREHWPEMSLNLIILLPIFLVFDTSNQTLKSNKTSQNISKVLLHFWCIALAIAIKATFWCFISFLFGCDVLEVRNIYIFIFSRIQFEIKLNFFETDFFLLLLPEAAAGGVVWNELFF